MIGAVVVAVPVLEHDEGLELGPGAAEVLEDLEIDLWPVLDAADAPGRAGAVTRLPLARRAESANPSLRILLCVGVGDGSAAGCRRGGAALARTTAGVTAVASSVHAVGGDDCVAAFVEGAVLGSFSFSMRGDRPPSPVERIVLAQTTDADDNVLAKAVAMASAGWRARTLATVPSNIKTPRWLAQQAEAVAGEAGLKCRVWDERQLSSQGFGGICAVGQGSANPPRLVQLDYRPARGARRAAHVVLVGKGITFDTGGLQLKRGESMVSMKRDMTGAGVVLSVLAALREVDCPVRVTGLLAIAENSVGGSSMRPGDVLRHYGGRTTEVVNTDAEGRLVMADAIAYAVEKLSPDVVVDIATLTGAMKVALGLGLGGMMSTHDALARQFLAAGDAAGEPLWRMPLAQEYAESLHSAVADAVNAPESAKAITAALFLQPFTAGLPWVHLDIGSAGDSLEDDFEWTKGPTGFGPRLLLRWLSDPELEGLDR